MPSRWRQAGSWTLGFLTLVAVYVLSSGPVLATAFCLREFTGWDGFYAAMFLYYPFVRSHDHPVDAYIEWWVDAFNTVGPG